MLVSYREASIHDCPAVAKVQVRSWRESFAGIVPQTVTDRITVDVRTRAFEQRFQSDSYKMFVAEVAEHGIVGFADCGDPRLQIETFESELYAIFLLPEFQGAGVGRELFSRCLRTVADRGKSSMYLQAFEFSPYRPFYDKLAGRVAGKRPIEIEGTTFNSVVYVWENLRPIA